MANISTTESNEHKSSWDSYTVDMWHTIQLICVIYKLCQAEMSKHGKVTTD